MVTWNPSRPLLSQKPRIAKTGIATWPRRPAVFLVDWLEDLVASSLDREGALDALESFEQFQAGLAFITKVERDPVLSVPGSSANFC